MRRFWHKLNGRQRAMLAVVLVLAVLLGLQYVSVPLEELPLPSSIAALEGKLEKRREALAKLEAHRSEGQDALAKLGEKAGPFWQIQGKDPKVEVPNEFARLARKAQVTIQQVGAPRTEKVLDLTHVRAVEFSVRLTASMREISRLMAQIERSERVFYWSRCNIRPDNKRAPKTAVLNGRIRALVLSAEASKFLSGEEQNDG